LLPVSCRTPLISHAYSGRVAISRFRPLVN
jgi:hypothetical protein